MYRYVLSGGLASVMLLTPSPLSTPLQRAQRLAQRVRRTVALQQRRAQTLGCGWPRVKPLDRVSISESGRATDLL